MPSIPAGNPAKPEGEDGRALLARMNGGHHEQLAVWGLTHLEFPPSATMLDIGCGGGANLKRLLARAKNGHACGIDYSPLSVELSRETCAEEIEAGTAAITQADVTRLPFEDDTFDIITAFETVYFWQDMFEALNEIHRVIKPGGRFLICNEANGATPEMYEQADALEGMTMYTAKELKLLLIGCDFEIEEIDDTGEKGWLACIARTAAPRT